MKSLIPLLLLAFLCGQSKADALAPSSHGHDWPKIIDPLLHSGLKRLGKLDLVKFRARAAQVKWWRLDSAPTADESGSRESAYYDRGGMAVHIVEELPESEAASLPTLELHEALGATGMANDNDYQISTALHTLAQMPAGSERSALAARYADTLFGTQVAMGGTSVSGGGDLSAVAVKQAVLQRIAGSYSRLRASKDFLTLYPQIAFEPQRTGTGEVVTLKYSQLNHSRRQEKLSVFIPMRTWNEGAEAQSHLTDDAALKISEIFPAREGATRTIHPSACTRADQVITFPATQDEQVANVQDFRGGLILGCEDSGTSGVTEDTMTTAPSPSAEAPDPLSAPTPKNIYSVSCEFRYGAAHLAHMFYAVRGGRGMALFSTPWSVENGDDLSANVATNPTGRIVWVGIQFVDGSGSRAPFHPQKSVDGQSAEDQLTVNGQALSLRCEKAN